MPLIQRITGIGNVAQGSTATVSIPVGPRYFWLKFWVYVNNTLVAADTVIGDTRLKVNTKIQRNLTATRTLKLNSYKGTPDATGCLSFHFAEPGMADKQDEVVCAWDTYGEQDFTVELDLKELEEETDVIKIVGLMAFDFGFWADAKGQRQKLITRHATQAENLPAGAFDITKIPTKFPIRAIHMDGTQDITLVEVDRDGTRVWEATNIQSRAIIGDYGQVGNTFKYSIDFCYREQIGDALRVGQTLNIRATSAAAQTVNNIIESVVTSFND